MSLNGCFNSTLHDALFLFSFVLTVLCWLLVSLVKNIMHDKYVDISLRLVKMSSNVELLMMIALTAIQLLVSCMLLCA